MDKLYSALVESTIIMGSLALMFGGTICWMYAHQQNVPGELLGLLGTIIGFWLRSKAGVEIRKNISTDQE
jgi:hypothetical protein